MALEKNAISSAGLRKKIIVQNTHKTAPIYITVLPSDMKQHTN